MPLVKRHVDPVNLARRKIPPKTSNELEFVTNATLVGALSQLSSLSYYAQDIFEELGEEAKDIGTRIDRLTHRVQQVHERVDLLNDGKSDLGPSNIHDYPGKLGQPINRGSTRVLDRSSMPHVLNTYYENNCHSPPSLQILDNCRPDDDRIRQSLKLYTDPDFFFELWRDKIQQQNRMDLQRRKKNKTRNASRMQRKPSQTGIEMPATRREQWRSQGAGKELADSGYNSSTIDVRKYPQAQKSYSSTGSTSSGYYPTMPSGAAQVRATHGQRAVQAFSPPQNGLPGAPAGSGYMNQSGVSPLSQTKPVQNGDLYHVPPPAAFQDSPTKRSPSRQPPAPPQQPGHMPPPPQLPSINENSAAYHSTSTLPTSHFDTSRLSVLNEPSNINRQSSISKLPPPKPLDIVDVPEEKPARMVLESPPMPSPPKNDVSFSQGMAATTAVATSMFPAHVVGTPGNVPVAPPPPPAGVPAPPPIGGLGFTNKFADLTLTRPKKNKTRPGISSLATEPQRADTADTASTGSGGGGDHRLNLLAEIRKGKQLRKIQAQEKMQKTYQTAVSKPANSNMFDVAELLASRRIFIKDDSDTNDETSSTFGTEEDDDEWE